MCHNDSHCRCRVVLAHRSVSSSSTDLYSAWPSMSAIRQSKNSAPSAAESVVLLVRLGCGWAVLRSWVTASEGACHDGCTALSRSDGPQHVSPARWRGSVCDFFFKNIALPTKHCGCSQLPGTSHRCCSQPCLQLVHQCVACSSTQFRHAEQVPFTLVCMALTRENNLGEYEYNVRRCQNCHLNCLHSSGCPLRSPDLRPCQASWGRWRSSGCKTNVQPPRSTDGCSSMSKPPELLAVSRS